VKTEELKYSNINWDKCNKQVLKIQRKIIVAWKKEEKEKVEKLQETLVKSFAARAIAVRKVTTNEGKKTPGIDKVLIKTREEKEKLISELKNLNQYKAKPVKRVYIPKNKDKNKRNL